jgi:uncharacterized protein (TIGR02145 family)
MGACPAGWRLPAREEWDELINFAGPPAAGARLKSKSPDWDGTDDLGFSAMPGGTRSADRDFFNRGSLGRWWSATERDASSAYLRAMNAGGADAGEYDFGKLNGFSVRCLQDPDGGAAERYAGAAGETPDGSDTDLAQTDLEGLEKVKDDDITAVYWSAGTGENRSPLENSEDGGPFIAKYYSNLNLEIITKSGNDGKFVAAALEGAGEKFELEGVVSRNKVIFEQVFITHRGKKKGPASAQAASLDTAATERINAIISKYGSVARYDSVMLAACESYADNYEPLHIVGQDTISMLGVFNYIPDSINNYLIDRAKNNDFRALKYAYVVVYRQSLSIKEIVTTPCLPETNIAAQGFKLEYPNGFVDLLARAMARSEMEEWPEDWWYGSLCYPEVFGWAEENKEKFGDWNYIERYKKNLKEEDYFNKLYFEDYKHYLRHQYVLHHRGFLDDSRDGESYNTIKINGKTWMAENLNYKADSSWCYGNTDSNCVKYGRLYTWNAAVKACPDGWRLPARKEWDGMINFMGGAKIAGTKLKSKSPYWDGTDDLEFSALPGGFRNTGGTFSNLGSGGRWWSATENNASHAYSRSVRAGDALVTEASEAKSIGLSVRCLQD